MNTPPISAGFFMRRWWCAVCGWYGVGVVFDFAAASNYFFIDLFAIICMLSSIWLLGNHRRFGFVVGLTGAIAFVIFGVLAESLFAILGNLLLGAIYLRGWFCWTPQEAVQG